MSFNQVCVRRYPPTFSSDLDGRVFLCPQGEERREADDPARRTRDLRRLVNAAEITQPPIKDSCSLAGTTALGTTD